MSDFPRSDLVVTERAALVGWWLADGAHLATWEIADRVGLKLKSTYHMMYKVARAVPIALDDEGRWHRVDQPLTKRVVRVR